jgi:hypothetical protein
MPRAKSTGKPKEIHCEFYDVHISDSASDTLLDVLRVLESRCPDTPSRNWEPITGEDIYRIDHLTFSATDNSCRGIFRRLRPDKIPMIGSKERSETHEIELSEDESVIEESCFVFYENHNVLIRERNRDAGSFHNIAKYLRNKTDYRGILLSFHEKTNQNERFNRTHHIKKLELSGYQAGLGMFSEDEDPIIDSEPLRIMQYFTGYRVKIEISQVGGKLSVPLEKSKIQEIIDHMRRGDGPNIDMFKIYGDHNNPNEPDFIDFIKNRVTYKESIRYHGAEPGIQQRFSVIENAYHARFRHDEQS